MNYFAAKARLIIFILRIFYRPFRRFFPPRPSASALIIRNGKILVVDLSYKNGYALPGGGVELYESFEDGVRREVWEETGLKVTKLTYFGSYWAEDVFMAADVVYLAEVSGTPRDSKEGILKWVTPAETLGKLVFRDNREAVKKWISLRK